MPKRFTDPDKWKDEWFLGLTNDQRIIWFYIIDTCTNAGRWKKNFKLLNFCCNSNIDETLFKDMFNGRVIDKESYYFIPKYVYFQNPKGLNSEKPAVVAIREELIQYGLVGIIIKLYGKEYLTLEEKHIVSEKETNEQEYLLKYKTNTIYQYLTTNVYFKTIKYPATIVYCLMDTYKNEELIIRTLKKMNEWLIANPNREKKSYERFILGWFRREEGKIEMQNAFKKLGESKGV
jgi:hypothetical protein